MMPILNPLAESPLDDQIDSPAPARRVIVLATLALCGGIALTSYLARSSYQSYTGYLQAKSRPLTAGRDARIAKFEVNQGDVVESGTPLLVLKDLQLEAEQVAKQRE